MTEPKSVREEIEALCPCRGAAGWEYATPQVPTEICLRWCACGWTAVSLDHKARVHAPQVFQSCRWPGHALALRLAAQVEALQRGLVNIASLTGRECAPDVALGVATSAVESLTKERDEARLERDRLLGWKQSVDEALNSGDGVYRP